MPCGTVIRTHLVNQGTAMGAEGEGKGQEEELPLAYNVLQDITLSIGNPSSISSLSHLAVFVVV